MRGLGGRTAGGTASTAVATGPSGAVSCRPHLRAPPAPLDPGSSVLPRCLSAHRPGPRGCPPAHPASAAACAAQQGSQSCCGSAPAGSGEQRGGGTLCLLRMCSRGRCAWQGLLAPLLPAWAGWRPLTRCRRLRLSRTTGISSGAASCAACCAASMRALSICKQGEQQGSGNISRGGSGLRYTEPAETANAHASRAGRAWHAWCCIPLLPCP
jgi:hypothetical protein